MPCQSEEEASSAGEQLASNKIDGYTANKKVEVYASTFYLQVSVMANKTQSRRLFICKNHRMNDFLFAADKPLWILRFVFKCPKYESIPFVDLGIAGV